MRHELQIGDIIITTDNSGGIGEKPMDAVKAPDKLTAQFAARVALLEQWAADSEPQAVLLHNFSGEQQWASYVEGIEELFRELGCETPPITGSSETNMPTLQSGIAVTLIGKRIHREISDSVSWFVYGVPLVGNEVLEKKEQIADLKKLYDAWTNNLIERLWPVGSKGIAHEAELLLEKEVAAIAGVDILKSAGPATCVLIAVKEEKKDELQNHFGEFLFPFSS